MESVLAMYLSYHMRSSFKAVENHCLGLAHKQFNCPARDKSGTVMQGQPSDSFEFLDDRILII